MAPDHFFEAGTGESTKLGVHLALLGLASACTLYNMGAWLSRRESHLAVNVGTYAALVGFEIVQIRRHMWEIVHELPHVHTPVNTL